MTIQEIDSIILSLFRQLPLLQDEAKLEVANKIDTLYCERQSLIDNANTETPS